MSTLRRRFAGTLAGSVVAQAATALTYVLLARHAGPHVYGEAMSVVSLAAGVVALVDFGASSLLLREAHRATSVGDHDRFAPRMHVWATQRIMVLLLAGALVGVVVLAAGGRFAVAAAATFVALSLSQVTQTLLQARLQFGVAAVLLATERLAWLALTFLALKEGMHLDAAIGLPGVLATIPVLLVALSRVSFSLPSPREISRENPWSGSFHFGVSAVAVGMLSFDVALVRAFGSAPAAGQFAAVNRWIQPFNIFSAAYSRSVYPHLVDSDEGSALRALRSGTRVFAATAAACVLAAAASPVVVPLVLGRAFADSTATFALLMISVPAMMVNQPLNLYLQSRGYEKVASQLVIFAIALQLTCVATLAHVAGSTGAALGFSAGQYVLTVLLALAVSRRRSSPVLSWGAAPAPVRFRETAPRRAATGAATRSSRGARVIQGRHGSRTSTRATTRRGTMSAGTANQDAYEAPPGDLGLGIFGWCFLLAEGLLFGLRGILPGLTLSPTVLAYLKLLAVLVLAVVVTLRTGRAPSGSTPRVNPAFAALLLVTFSFAVTAAVTVSGAEVDTFLRYSFALALPAATAGCMIRPRDLLRAQVFGVALGLTLLFMFAASSASDSTAGEFALNNVGGSTHLLVGQSAVVVALIALSLIERHGPKWIFASLATVGLAVYLIIASGSRGSLVALAVAVPMYFLFAARRGTDTAPRVKLSTAVFVTGSTIFVGGFTLSSLGSDSVALSRFSSLLSGGDKSTQIRQYYYEITWDSIQHHVLLGGGPASFARDVGRYAYPHQMVLEVWNDFGLVGLAIGSLVGLVALARLARTSPGGPLVAALLVSTLVMLQFSGSYTTSYLLWFFLAAAFTRGAKPGPPSGAGRSRRRVAVSNRRN